MLQNQSTLYAFCSYEHYALVASMLMDWDSVDFDALSTGYDAGTYNAFWGSEFVRSWIQLLSRMVGWVIEDSELLGECSKTPRNDEDYQVIGRCWGRFSTIVFDSYL